MEKRAVANKEISANLLKARKKVGSHLGSVRRLLTAQAICRAVANKEISANLLKARIDGRQSTKVNTVNRDCPGAEAGSSYP